MNIYKDLGYTDRSDYLRSLADEYAVHLSTVKMLADLLGPGEDFDGLVSSLADAEDWGL